MMAAFNNNAISTRTPPELLNYRRTISCRQPLAGTWTVANGKTPNAQSGETKYLKLLRYYCLHFE
jgi:hypothetical protein